MANECPQVEYLSEWPPPKSVRHNKRSVIEDECDLENKKSRPNADESVVGDSEFAPSSEESDIVEKSPSVPITSLLAQWWKLIRRSSNSSSLSEHDSFPHFNSAYTLLYHICKLPNARHFLQSRVRYLETLPLIHETQYALSTAHYQLQHYDTALSYAQRAVEGDPGNQEMMWHLELTKRQNSVVRVREARQAALDLSVTDLKMPQPTEVERRSASELSYEEFYTQYALTHSPVIITDITNTMTAQPWTLDYIKQAIGHMVAPLKRLVAESVEWAKLEPAGEATVAHFIDSLFQDQSNISELKYLFDWSLPLHCPELAAQLTIPRYFAGDLLQRIESGTLYRDSWPSLFVAPAGIVSELHVDAFGSNFWMALFQGKKRWLIFPPEDLPLLYPTYTHSTDAVFDVSLSQPDFTLHPLLSLTHPVECVLSPGDLLFVPAGSPHRVVNLEPSLAISVNYVDQSNFDGVVQELTVNALRDQRAKDLLEKLTGPNFNSSVDFKQNSLTWQDFKTWPRPNSTV